MRINSTNACAKYYLILLPALKKIIADCAKQNVHVSLTRPFLSPTPKKKGLARMVGCVRLHSSYCAFGKLKSMASGPDQAQKVEEKLFNLHRYIQGCIKPRSGERA